MKGVGKVIQQWLRGLRVRVLRGVRVLGSVIVVKGEGVEKIYKVEGVGWSRYVLRVLRTRRNLRVRGRGFAFRWLTSAGVE